MWFCPFYHLAWASPLPLDVGYLLQVTPLPRSRCSSAAQPVYSQLFPTVKSEGFKLLNWNCFKLIKYLRRHTDLSIPFPHPIFYVALVFRNNDTSYYLVIFHYKVQRKEFIEWLSIEWVWLIQTRQHPGSSWEYTNAFVPQVRWCNRYCSKEELEK